MRHGDNAKRFLDKPQNHTPFLIQAMQVDGGSEFRADFETECRHRDIDRRIDAFADAFNTFRPHQALGGHTPARYLHSLTAKETPRVSYVLDQDRSLTRTGAPRRLRAADPPPS